MPITLKSSDHNNPPPRRAKKMTAGVRPFSRDRLMMVPRDEACKSAMALLHVVQDESPEIAVAGVVTLFAVWCNRLGVDPYEMHQLGKKIIAPQFGHQKADIQAEVLRDFAGIRLVGDERVEAN